MSRRRDLEGECSLCVEASERDQTKMVPKAALTWSSYCCCKELSDQKYQDPWMFGCLFGFLIAGFLSLVVFIFPP